MSKVKNLTTVKDLKEILDNFNDKDIIKPCSEILTGDTETNLKNIKPHVDEIILVSKDEDNLLNHAFVVNRTLVVF